MSNPPRWQFGPLEDNQWGGCCLNPKKSRREIFQRIFAIGIFWGGVSRYAVTPLIVGLPPGHNDISRFRPWPENRDRESFGSRRKKFQNLLRRLTPLTFWSAFRHFGTHLAESFRVSKSSWMMDLTRSRGMLSCSAIDLAEILRSSKISSWICSIISGVVTVGSSRTRRITGGKITTFKLGHPVFDGGIRWCMFP